MTDIVIRNLETDEVLCVFSTEGYDLNIWEIVETTIPVDIGAVPYKLIGDMFVRVRPTAITQADFLALFTPWEQVMAASSDDAAMKTTLMLLQAHTIVHLDDVRVDDGLTLMVSLGIIDATRKAQVLSNTPPV